jgi:tRNA threonylcarbamoyladenosine biosynthesis protein TsaB
VRLLAIETAGSDVATALADESGVLASLTARAGRRHAEVLHPMVAEICRIAGVGLPEVDAVAVDVGPGLFTGIRVGLAAAKGFALGLGVPLVPLTSLEILGAALEPLRQSGSVVVPMMDLRRGEIGWAVAEPGQPFPAPRLSPPEVAAGEIRRLVESGARLALAGDGARRYAELFPVEAVIAGPELSAPPVASLAVRAVQALAAGAVADPVSVEPVYLREPDARINWSAMHQGALGPERGEGGGES